MVITVICDVLGRENNGTTIAAKNLIRALQERGHTVRVVCSDTELKDTPGYYIVPRRNLGIFNGYFAKNGVALSKPDKKILEEAIDGADAVHSILPFALGVAAMKIVKKRGIPLTAGFHCQAENITGHLHMMKNCGPLNRTVYRVFYKRFYRYCDFIHYPTQFICDTFENVVGLTPHKIISNGVNDMYRPKSVEKPDELKDRFVVLFIGRYSPEKSHDVLIDAVALSSHKDKIQLVFAGDGPRKEEIIRRVHKRGILMPIMNFYDRKTLIDIINYADLYVHPAEIEIEAIACLEAISCGKVPLIADSPRSATRYFALTDRNLFRFNDPRHLAEQMDWWLDHPDERRACSERYLGYAEQFDYERCMDRMEKMIIEATDKHNEK